MGKRGLVALLNLSSWCLVMVGRLFLAVPWGCLRFVIVVFPDHTHLLFLNMIYDIPDPTQLDRTSNFFVLCINMKIFVVGGTCEVKGKDANSGLILHVR